MTQLAMTPTADAVPWNETRSRARPKSLDLVGSIAGALMLVVWISTVFLDPVAERDDAGGGGSSASAADLAAREIVVAGYVGGAHSHPSDVRFLLPGKTDLTVHGVEWIGRPFKTPIYYGLRAIRWHGVTGTMLDFTHSKAIAPWEQTVKVSGTRNGRTPPETAKIRDMFKHLEFSHGHNMLTLNRLFRLSPSMARIGPYVGGGAGVNLPHTEVQFLDEPDRTYEYQYTGPTGQVLAGVELRLPRVSLFFEYKLSVSHYTAPLSARDNKSSFGYSDFFVQLAAWWRGEKPKYGTATTWIVSHNLVGGAGGRFGTGDAVAP
jgi:lipid A oxidase